MINQAIIDDLRARNPGTLLLFRDGAFFAAYGEDALAIIDLTAGMSVGGRPIALWIDTTKTVAKFGATRLDDVLALVVAAGRSAAVLERVAASDVPKRATVERVVLPGEA